jgi:hypothetical protein
MSQRDRSTEPSNDPELRAMLALRKALEPLDTDGCRRVLAWANARYVESHRFHMDDFDTDAFANFTKALNESARKLGTVAPLDILKFVEYVDELKKQEANGEVEVEEGSRT